MFAVTTVTALLSFGKELQVLDPNDHRPFTPNIAAANSFKTMFFSLKSDEKTSLLNADSLNLD